MPQAPTPIGWKDDGTPVYASSTMVPLSRFAQGFTDTAASIPQSFVDVATGAAKGLPRTLLGFGQMALNIGGPSVTADKGLQWVTLADTVDAIGKAAGVELDSRKRLAELRASPILQPTNTAQSVGLTGEQIAEFLLLPSGKVKVGAKAVGLIPKVAAAVKAILPEAIVQGAGAAALTEAQTGETNAATRAALLGAVAPIAGRVAEALPVALKNAAQRNIYRFLAPTKEVTKAEAGRIIPSFLERGTIGTRMGVKEVATAGEQTAGTAVGVAERAAAAANPGNVVSTKGLRDAMAFMEQKAVTTDAAGKVVPVAGREQLYAITKKFREFAESLPDQIPIEQAADLKRQWQAVVTAGKAWDSTLPDRVAANVAKRAAARIRTELLKEAPDLRAVYAEYGYQRGLRDVLTQTIKRTAAHEPGWMKRAWLPATLSGGASFEQTHDPWKAAAGFVAGSVLGRMMASPLWQTVSGQLKSRLADAIVAGKADSVVRAIVKAVPSIMSESAAPTTEPAATAIVAPDVVQNATAGIHTLSDGSVWQKNADGTVVRLK